MPSHSPEPLFRQTNVSRPRLQHSDSAQSVTASEDYYSFTDSANSDDSALPPPIRRYQTPPSRYRTPMASGERLPRDYVEPTREQWNVPMRGPGRRRQSDGDRTSYPNPLQSNPRMGAVSRKPVPSTVYEGNSPETTRGPIPDLTMSSAAKDLNREPSPPTPEADDTPYIHFALDQLTRDEEVRGSRLYPGPKSTIAAVRPDSRNALRPSYVSMSPEGFDNRPGSRSGFVSPVESPMDPEKDGRLGAISPLEADQESNGTPVETVDAQEIPPRHPGRNGTQGSSHRPSPPETFLAFEGPSGVPYLSLDYLPVLLRPIPFAAFLLALTLFLIALIFTAVWSVVKRQLWGYVTFADSRYFVFQYLPTIIAILLLLWLIEIQKAAYRVAPFIAFTSNSARTRSRAALLPIYPSSFFWPTFTHFSAGQPAVGAFVVASWLSLFTVPLLSTSFNVYQVNGMWMWLATQGVIWTVIGLYFILLTSSIWLLAYLRRRQTGLKWDPISLADFLVLMEKSNLLDTHASYFHINSEYDFKEDIAARGDRLGYWRTSARPNAAIHTIAAPGQPARQYNVENGILVEKTNPRYSNQTFDLEAGRPYSHGTVRSLLPKRFSKDSTASIPPPLSYLPWFLKSLVPILLATTFLALLLAFLVVSYLPTTAIQSGFLPELPIPVDNLGFSPANFLYSFIPSLLGLALFLLWTNLDLTLRRLQPIANLSHPRGATAESSLLLSYPSDPPVLVTLKALVNSDYRIAATSIVSLLASALPILGGGVFWAQFYVPTQEVRISGDLPAFYALTAIFAIVCLAFLALPMTGKQRKAYAVPSPDGSRKRNTATRLVDLIALAHQSRLLSDAVFRAPASRVQMVTRLLANVGADAAYPSPAPATGIAGGRRDGAREPQQGLGVAGPSGAAAASKVSLADSIRGFGEARAMQSQERALNSVMGGAAGAGQEGGGDMGRFRIGRYVGRDGKMYVGVDRAGRIVDENGERDVDGAKRVDGEKR